jgi:transcriptional antiterminator NusG
MFGQESEEQFGNEPLISGEQAAQPEQPVLSDSQSAAQEAPAPAVEPSPAAEAEPVPAPEPSPAPEIAAGPAPEPELEPAPTPIVEAASESERAPKRPHAPEPKPEVPAESVPEGPAWYVIHCYSGYENKVRHNLEQRIETMGMKDKVFDVVVPTQEEIEVRDGKRRTVERHIFPGYVLVNMVLTEESWFVVRNTPGVTGFVGMGNLPTPLRPEEVAQILKRMEAEAPTVKVSFKVGERVRIIDGPFNDFRGQVAEIDMERTKVRVMVSFFGRETPVELDFLQVEKA